MTTLVQNNVYLQGIRTPRLECLESPLTLLSQNCNIFYGLGLLLGMLLRTRCQLRPERHRSQQKE